MSLFDWLFSKKSPQPTKIDGSVVYGGPPISGLQQTDVIRELKRLGLSRKDAEAKVQGALVIASSLDSSQIQAIHSSDNPITQENLAIKWAAHCIYHGAKPRGL